MRDLVHWQCWRPMG